MSDEYLKKGDRIVKNEINDMKKLSIMSKRRQNLKQMLQNQAIYSRGNNSGAASANTNSRTRMWNRATA